MSKENNGPFVVPKMQDDATLDLDIYLPTYIWLEGSKETLQVDVLNGAAPKLYEALKKRVENEGQQVFEDWLSRECPSGDVDAVNSQWMSSSDYIDFCEQWNEELGSLAAAHGESVRKNEKGE